MKQKYAIGFITFMLATVLAACVHDYPAMTPDGEEGIDPTLVEVSTEVTLDLELLPLEIITNKAHRGITKARAGEQTDYRRRFIIEAWRDGKPAARQVTVMDNADEAGNGKITLPVHLKLYAVEYTLAVWTDYVVAGTTTDLYYNTENLQQVTCTTPYTGSTGYRDCLYGSTTLDLRPYRDELIISTKAGFDMWDGPYGNWGSKKYLTAGKIPYYRHRRAGVSGKNTAATRCRRRQQHLHRHLFLRVLFPVRIQHRHGQADELRAGRDVLHPSHHPRRRHGEMSARFGLYLRERHGILCAPEY